MKGKELVVNAIVITLFTVILSASYYNWHEGMERTRKTLENENKQLHGDFKKEKEQLEATQKALEQKNERLRQGLNETTSHKADCTEWLKYCEAQCTSASNSSIPKHVHFISLHHPFSFHEWVAVVSARNKIKPDKITVYTDGLQDSCWWRRALPYIEHQLIHLLPGMNMLNRSYIQMWAHKSDFLRVSILYHYGGIYMDTDAISLKSFDSLLSNQVVLAMQCHNRVAVGVMMAQKHNCFICQYAHLSCQNFGGKWATHTVRTISALVKKIDTEKEGIAILTVEQGFFPLCYDKKGLHQLYREDINTFSLYNLSEIYAVHLFAHNTEKKLLPTTLFNMDWIHNSKSLAAIAIRESLPSGFSKHHLDEKECASLEFDN